MRESSKLMRWGLLVVLALCVVLMHHVPQQHEHDSAHSPTPVATQTATMSEHHEAPAAPEHGLLHLCLAVIAGFVALMLPFLQRIARSSAATAGRLALSAIERLRPPLPVPRRLAVLCVLRR